MTKTNSEVQPGKNRNTGPSNPPAEPEADYEETLRQRSNTRVSTSTKLPGTDRVTPSLVTPLVDSEASIEEALTNIVDSIGEQILQMSLLSIEEALTNIVDSIGEQTLQESFHIERGSQREEINCNRQEVSRSEKRLKERTDEHMAKILSQTTRKAKQRDTRLRDHMEKFRSLKNIRLGFLTQEQTR